MKADNVHYIHADQKERGGTPPSNKGNPNRADRAIKISKSALRYIMRWFFGGALSFLVTISATVLILLRLLNIILAISCAVDIFALTYKHALHTGEALLLISLPFVFAFFRHIASLGFTRLKKYRASYQ